jgi:two-component system cell cycle sensor histidine kinase/response regulator CckA
MNPSLEIPPLEVVFIEDNPSDLLVITARLEEVERPKVHLTHVSSLREGLTLLRRRRFHAALLDLHLPDSQGIGTVDRLRQEAPELPLIVLTGSSDSGLVSQILAKGAQDYLVKQDVTGLLLAKAILYAIERHRVAVELDRRTRKLAESESRIREQAALIHEARDAILVFDLEGKITFWNKGAERMHGWTASEVLGRQVREFLHENPTRFEEAWLSLKRAGEWAGEMSKLSRDGRELLTDTRLTLVHDEAGNPKAVLSISTDITERKKLESKLLRVQRMESIGALAGGIAHDLNNVLAPVLMSADMLGERLEDPDAKALVQTISESARRGAEMVRQVLTFARGVESNRAAVDPRYLIADVARIFEDTFLKSIQIRTRLEQDVWSVIGDRTQLHQVLMNLGINARDAMPQGGELSIIASNVVFDATQASMSPEARPGPYVVFAVADSGSGISPDIIEKIFDPFFTTKPVGEGTGLGLATVQGIVKSHGGFVNVYSEPGRGTTFRVYLPARQFDGARSAETRAANLPRGNGELVLVVDDEASIRQITRYTLEAFGYRTLLARDGTEALALYAEHRMQIAVVLTDMMMPIMDGNVTIRALKAMNPNVRTIAASGLGSESQCRAATVAGCNHFLPKPYTAEAVLEALHSVLHPEPSDPGRSAQT